MFGKHKQKKNLWPLRPSALPTSKMIEAEPRIANLENNALFRLAAFRARLKRRNKTNTVTQWIDAGLLLLFFLGGVFGLLFVFVFILARAIYRRTNINHRKSHALCALFDIETEQMIELRQAALTSEDLLRAAWGLEIRRKRNQILGFDVGLVTELIAALGLIGVFPETSVVLLPALGVVNGFIFWQRIVMGDTVLAALRDVGFRLHEMVSLAGVGRQIVNFFGQICVMVWMIIIIVVSFKTLQGPGGRYQDNILPALVSSVLCMLVAAAAGFIQRNQTRIDVNYLYDNALDHTQTLFRQFDEFLYAEKK